MVGPERHWAERISMAGLQAALRAGRAGVARCMAAAPRRHLNLHEDQSKMLLLVAPAVKYKADSFGKKKEKEEEGNEEGKKKK